MASEQQNPCGMRAFAHTLPRLARMGERALRLRVNYIGCLPHVYTRSGVCMRFVETSLLMFHCVWYRRLRFVYSQHGIPTATRVVWVATE